jgi:hypothetical protein
MATVNVTLSLSSTDLFAKQNISFTESDILSPAGAQQLVGKLEVPASGKSNIALAALAGTNDLAYVFLHNLSSTADEYVKVGLCAAHGTDSASGDWFAVLGPGEFMFMPISDMQDIDLESNGSATPSVEYVLMEKAA